MNPAELLLLALDTPDRPARAIEGLTWLPLAFPNLDWPWLLREARLRNRQNRLGFLLELSRQAAMRANVIPISEDLKRYMELSPPIATRPGRHALPRQNVLF